MEPTNTFSNRSDAGRTDRFTSITCPDAVSRGSASVSRSASRSAASTDAACTCSDTRRSNGTVLLA